MNDQISALSTALKSVKQFFSSTSYKSAIQACPNKPIVGTEWRNAARTVFPGQQSYQNCGIQSARQLVEQARHECLWESQAGLAPQSGRHAVVLTHGGYDADGQLLGVYVNDTGINKRYYLTNDELSDVLDSGSGSMNVTDRRIWPANE